MKREEVFVTGATGFIGQHLVNRLLGLGLAVRVLTRDPGKIPEGWKNRVSVVKGDLSDKSLEIGKDIKRVFHCAGEIRDIFKFRETNVEGTKNLIRSCLEQKNCGLTALSSVGVMGADKPGIADESLECRPKNAYEKTKFAAENAIQDAVREHGLNAVILRPSIVYGPGIARENDSFLALIRAIKNGKFCFFGRRPGYYNIVYSADVVEAMIFLSLLGPDMAGQVFIINDPITWPEFTRIVLSRLELRKEVVRIPYAFGYLLAFLSEIGRLAGAKTPLSLNRFRAMTCKTIFKSDKLIEKAGFRLDHGNFLGIADTIDYYRHSRLLE